MNTLYAIVSKDQKVYVQLSFQSSGYCVSVQDVITKQSVTTSYGFGIEGLLLAKHWMEKASGVSFKRIREVNQMLTGSVGGFSTDRQRMYCMSHLGWMICDGYICSTCGSAMIESEDMT